MSGPLSRSGRTTGCLCALAFAACLFPVAASALDLGFLASRDRDVHGNDRSRLLGPFIERTEAPDGRVVVAVRPLFSRVSNPADQRRVTDVLWPVSSIRSREHEVAWRFLTALGSAVDPARGQDESSYRVWFLPLYLQGRDKIGRDYVYVFPLGGKIYEFLGQDVVTHVLFPLVSHSVRDELQTWHVLWPLISWSRGPGVRKVKFFPFYGRMTEADEQTRSFVLWPIWTAVDYHSPKATGGGFMLFPLFGRMKIGAQESWAFLPPLFRWMRTDRFTDLSLPWPLVQIRRGGNSEKTVFWPLWGRRKSGQTETAFFLWPLYSSVRQSVDRRHRQELYFGPFVSVSTEIWNPKEPGGEVRRRARFVKACPLGSYRREDDVVRFRMPELWPGRESPHVERNMAPLWSWLTYNRVGPVAETELLWGLFRRRHDAAGGVATSVFPLVSWSRASENSIAREWSVGKGLLGYRRGETGRSFRLLYWLRFGDDPRRASVTKEMPPSSSPGS